MIIFDLDGTLANCEHRRHFFDVEKQEFPWKLKSRINGGYDAFKYDYVTHENIQWQQDWRAFYDACDKDAPIYPVIGVLKMLVHCNSPIQIWSGRCESVRIKTHAWIFAHTGFEPCRDTVKMRPIGDNTPDDELKERWLDEYLESTSLRQWEEEYKNKHPIDFVFDDRPKVVRMWRRRGIFVFDCNQDGKEF